MAIENVVIYGNLFLVRNSIKAIWLGSNSIIGLLWTYMSHTFCLQEAEIEKYSDAFVAPANITDFY